MIFIIYYHLLFINTTSFCEGKSFHQFVQVYNTCFASYSLYYGGTFNEFRISPSFLPLWQRVWVKNFVRLESPWTKIGKIWDRNKIPPQDVLQPLQVATKICKFSTHSQKKQLRMAQGIEQISHLDFDCLFELSEFYTFCCISLALITFIFSGMYFVHYYA